MAVSGQGAPPVLDGRTGIICTTGLPRRGERVSICSVTSLKILISSVTPVLTRAAEQIAAEIKISKLGRRLSTFVIYYLYFLAANGIMHLLGPLGLFFSNRYLLNHPRSLLNHWHLFGLAHLNRALLKGMSRDGCFDRTPALDCDALTVQRHVPLHRPFHHVASYPCRAAINCALADLEVFLGQRDHFFGPRRGLCLSSNPGALRR